MADIDLKSAGSDDARGAKRSKRRLSIRLDMTPMVDIAFLLLIFYMVTTVFAAPQAMEVNLPAAGDTIDIPRSNILVIRVDSTGTCWLSMGDEKGSIYTIEKSNLLDSLESVNSRNMLLSTLIKIHPGASFSNYVDILDDIARAEAILQNNREFVEEYLVVNTEKLGPERFTDSVFSYRYTVGSWNSEKDNRIIRQAAYH
jgi:biopolymer transport protein ExbD